MLCKSYKVLNLLGLFNSSEIEPSSIILPFSKTITLLTCFIVDNRCAIIIEVLPSEIFSTAC